MQDWTNEPWPDKTVRDSLAVPLWTLALWALPLLTCQTARAGTPTASQNRSKARLLNAATKGDLSALKALVDRGADINTRDGNGFTPLMNAVFHRRHGVVRYLLAEHAQVNARGNGGKSGYSALLLATPFMGDPMAEWLLAAGADPNVGGPPDGQSPLLIALGVALDLRYKADDDALIAQLLRHGARVDVAAPNGMTALMLALYKDDRLAVRLLLEHGASVRATDRHGLTPLMYAVSAGAAALLLAHGAALEAKDADGDTTLTECVRSTNEEVLKYLVARGAAIDAVNRAGDSALMEAARLGQYDTARLLLQLGADPTIRDRKGQGALDLAVASGNSSVIGLIRGSLKRRTSAIGNAVHHKQVIFHMAPYRPQTGVYGSLKAKNGPQSDNSGSTGTAWHHSHRGGCLCRH